MKTIALDIDPITSWPLALVDLKDDLRIAHEDLNTAIVEQYIPAAVDMAETAMRRNIVPRTVRWIVDEFPYSGYEIALPRGKTVAVASIVYYHTNIATTTMRGATSGSPVGTDYREDLRGEWGRLWPAASEAWPAAVCDVPSPIVITFTAGWSAVPFDVLQALKGAIAHMVDGENNEARTLIEQLLSPYRIVW